jgi:hypothetical protein
MKTNPVLATDPPGGANGLLAILRSVLAQGARDWNVAPRTILALWGLPILVLLAGMATALAGKGPYKAFTEEDGIAETLQVLLYLPSLAMAVVIAQRLARSGDRLLAVLYAVLALGFVFLLGEELSWGQRVFGWGTPEALEALNKQGETNIHNIEGVGATFKWVQMLVGAYGAFLPLLVGRLSGLGRFRRELSFLVPPVSLTPFFGCMFLWRLYRNLLEPPHRFYYVVSEYNEVVELVLALGFFFFMVYQLRRLSEPSRAASA